MPRIRPENPSPYRGKTRAERTAILQARVAEIEAMYPRPIPVAHEPVVRTPADAAVLGLIEEFLK